MARNKYEGRCYVCGHAVAPGTGHFERYSGGWRTKHANVPGDGRITCAMAGEAERANALQSALPASQQERRMSDLVKRLRNDQGIGINLTLCREAADEIERLRAENTTARQAADDVYSRLMPEVELLREQLALERGKLREVENLFYRQWEAGERAIKRWQEAHPEKNEVWPDRADMVVWLMERHVVLREALQEAQIQLRECGHNAADPYETDEDYTENFPAIAERAFNAASAIDAALEEK